MEIFKYLFQRNLAIQLIYCEINFTLTWSQNCIIFDAPGGTTFKVTLCKTFCFSYNFINSKSNSELLQ